jgi:hypothetical protein
MNKAPCFFLQAVESIRSEKLELGSFFVFGSGVEYAFDQWGPMQHEAGCKSRVENRARKLEQVDVMVQAE